MAQINSSDGQSQENDDQSVDITPGVGVYAMFRSFNYKPWLALGEFLDNSISSYQQPKQRRRLH
jgi:hypothetical protein